MAASASAELDDEEADADEEAAELEELDDADALDALDDADALDDELAGAQANRHRQAISAAMVPTRYFFDMMSPLYEIRACASLPDLQFVGITTVTSNRPGHEKLEPLGARLCVGKAKRLVHERAVHPHGYAVASLNV